MTNTITNNNSVPIITATIPSVPMFITTGVGGGSGSGGNITFSTSLGGGFDSEYYAQLEKAQHLLDFLGIPWAGTGQYHVLELYDIFNDPAKCKELICKLRNRALW